MAPTKTTRVQHSTPKKNQFIGAMLATGKLNQSAALVGIPSSTASDLWKRYQETGSTSNCQRSGRPRKLTTRCKRNIITVIKSNHRKPFAEIANLIPEKISGSTVRRVAEDEGYHRRLALKVVYLTKLQKAKRLRWAKKYLPFTMKEWSNIIWSDECYIYMDDKHSKIYVTRRPDEKYDENTVVPTFKQATLRVMVWGCIMKGKKGPLVVLEYPGGKGGGMNAARYISQVLSSHLLQFYRKIKRRQKSVQFQQDGAPAHTAKATTKWLQQHHIKIFPHPPSSPDVSPIEPCWHELKKIIRARGDRPSSISALISAAQTAWDELKIEDIDKYIVTMPERVRDVIHSKGGHTRF